MTENLTEKVQIMVGASLVRRIDDWRFANRVASRSSAMRQLLTNGLEREAVSANAEAVET